eukprot:NODE_2488_length_1106_cov_7.070956_g2067_i0.p6 GENE.NODE_2488_length_1106_cov_7.070956_g2067_i0~~NODE_2488_length_1106_cov_7.070956_g2067_i0.p6  ORF type:complete len:50 (-),score=3.08 NODE_2488_length_1106_cov_7.070956_g2067_i0:221-370(-)
MWAEGYPQGPPEDGASGGPWGGGLEGGFATFRLHVLGRGSPKALQIRMI